MAPTPTCIGRSAELTSLHRVGAPDRRPEVTLGEAGLGRVLQEGGQLVKGPGHLAQAPLHVARSNDLRRSPGATVHSHGAAQTAQNPPAGPAIQENTHRYFSPRKSLQAKGPGRRAGVLIRGLEKIGAPDRIRTCGLRLRRAALYPAELRVRHAGLEPRTENAGTLRQLGRARKRSGPSPPPGGVWLRTGWTARGILWINGNLKDRLDSRQDLQDQIVWGVAVQFSVPRQPIQGPHLVGKNDTGNAGGRGDRHFERRRLCLVRHRACEYQARGHIVIERG